MSFQHDSDISTWFIDALSWKHPTSFTFFNSLSQDRELSFWHATASHKSSNSTSIFIFKLSLLECDWTRDHLSLRMQCKTGSIDGRHRFHSFQIFSIYDRKFHFPWRTIHTGKHVTCSYFEHVSWKSWTVSVFLTGDLINELILNSSSCSLKPLDPTQTLISHNGNKRRNVAAQRNTREWIINWFLDVSNDLDQPTLVSLDQYIMVSDWPLRCDKPV